VRKRYAIFIGAFVLIAFGLKLYPDVAQYWGVDKCLDAGGSWNYKAAECEYQ
jgi:hypothetical protein